MSQEFWNHVCEASLFTHLLNLHHTGWLDSLLYIGWIILAVSTMCSVTFVITSCRFYLKTKLSSKNATKEPATLPYWLPWIGSGLALAINPHQFFNHVMATSPGGKPVRIRITSMHMYMVTGAENIQALFRKSRNFTFEFMQLRVAQTVKGLPPQDAAKMSIDNSGTDAVPLTDVAEEDRIWRRLHHIYLDNLSRGPMVDGLTARFVQEFSYELNKIPSDGFVDTPLYAMLQDRMFTASTYTLAGRNILDANPTFAKSFWQYDAGFMRLLMGTPRLACRQAWDARDECLAATKKWLASAWSSIDWEAMTQQDPEWEPLFGHRLVRAREKCLDEFGISLDGRASLQLGLIWAINANAIPMAAYMLIEMIYDRTLLNNIRAELATIAGLEDTSSSIDIAALCALPLLNSVYKECLRLRASIPLTRRLHNDTEIGGYTLRAGNFILAPSWPSHQNEEVWGAPGRPASTFWAERFLKTTSGTGPGAHPSTKAGDYFPYGGGSIVCPGRFFAKQEILAAVAMVVTRLELGAFHNIDMQGNISARGPGVEKAESRGIIPLDRDVVVQIRRRGPHKF